MRTPRIALLVTRAVIAALACCALGPATASAFVYWANLGDTSTYDPSGTGGTIGRAENDGSKPRGDFIKGAYLPAAVAVDAQHIYWANASVMQDRTRAGVPSIGMADINGNSANQTWITDPGIGIPDGVAVDGTYVYWSDDGGYIGRARLDGLSPPKCGVTADPNYERHPNDRDPQREGQPQRRRNVELLSTAPTPTTERR